MQKLLKLQLLRTRLRTHSKLIVDNLIENHIQRNNKVINRTTICIFCGSADNITKEHVLPRWLFGNDTKRFFVTDVNGLGQTYNKTTIPTCSKCNSDILNSLEKYIKQLFENRNLKEKSFEPAEIENIIRWVEIIDYKFQVLDVIRKFKASKHGGFNQYLADFPISVLRASTNYSPSKVITEIRRCQKRIYTKQKIVSINSLVTFVTHNQSFYFFHQMNEFIFIELPRQKIALFHFYTKTFENVVLAHEDAMKTIKEVYEQ